jgi:hypothetical protein
MMIGSGFMAMLYPASLSVFEHAGGGQSLANAHSAMHLVRQMV